MSKKNRTKLGRFEIPRLKNSCDTLLANIRFASIEKRVKTIVVTSSGVDEGKSTVSSNLACVMASSGKRVLIVDTDMRRRSLGAMLNVRPQYGLYAVLTGGASVDAAIAKTSIQGVYFLDTEPNIPNPTDLLSSHRFAALVDALRDVFDYVVFDTPPLGAFVDAALVGNVVDGVVFVVRERVTKRTIARQCLAQLEAANAHVLGLVRTFAQEAESDSYYYAYYREDNTRVHDPKDKKDHAGPSHDIDDNFDTWVEHLDMDRFASRLGVSTGRAKAAHQASEADNEFDVKPDIKPETVRMPAHQVKRFLWKK